MNGVCEIYDVGVTNYKFKRLRGTHEGKYRYAVGDLRIVYSVNREEKTVLIMGPRVDIYK